MHVFDPTSETDFAVEVGQPVGAVAPTLDRDLVAVAVRDGFGVLHLPTSGFRLVASVEEAQPQNRMNDGKCDTHGRFWAGTQSLDHSLSQAGLYRLELDGSVTCVVEGVSVSNGIGWSPEDHTMYYVDTMTGGLDAFAFEPETGDVRGRRRLVDIPPAEGLPDGLAVDAEGCIWLALWGGSSIRRFDPSGRQILSIPMPVRYPTSCAFGGAGLDTLFVTSARRLPEEALGGSLFAIRPGATGLAPQVYRGSP